MVAIRLPMTPRRTSGKAGENASGTGGKPVPQWAVLIKRQGTWSWAGPPLRSPVNTMRGFLIDVVEIGTLFPIDFYH